MAINQLGDGSADGVAINGPITGSAAFGSASKVGFYGTAPVAQRATNAAHATSLYSASSYATVGANLAAFIVEVQNTLAGIGIWSD